MDEELEIDVVIESEEENLEIEMENDEVKIGTDDYNELNNKPKINNVEIQGNKTLPELGIQPEGDYPEQALTNSEIEQLLNNFV